MQHSRSSDLRVRSLLFSMVICAALATPRPGRAAPERYATLPCVSPDGRSVAYVRELSDSTCELRVVGLDAGGDRLLWSAPMGAGLPGWMPGGKRVSFLHTEGNRVTLHSVPRQGGKPRVEREVTGKGLALSRDGSRCAFAVGGWQRSVLTLGDARGRAVRALSDSTAGWFNLAWSPDGRSIASSHLDPAGGMQVWLVDVATGTSRALTQFPDSTGRPQWPSWSPDGKRIAVQAGRYSREHPEESVADVWTVEIESGRTTRIPTRTGTWMDETPSWCPDGKRIVFQSSRTGRFEVWVANLDGTGARSLTP